jgi:hypothetical protein
MSTVFDAFKMSPVFLERKHALEVSTVLRKLRARIIHLEPKFYADALRVPNALKIDLLILQVFKIRTSQNRGRIQRVVLCHLRPTIQFDYARNA